MHGMSFYSLHYTCILLAHSIITCTGGETAIEGWRNGGTFSSTITNVMLNIKGGPPTGALLHTRIFSASVRWKVSPLPVGY